MTEEQVQIEPLFEVDVKMDDKILYDYMLYHTYHGLSGILGTFVGIMMIFYFIAYHASPLYLIFGVVVLFYLPVNLYLSAKKQILGNEIFKKPLHYTFTKDGLFVSQEEHKDFVAWDNMRKAVSTGKSIIIYTSKVSATIIPRKACDGEVTELLAVIVSHMSPKKVKIKQ